MGTLATRASGPVDVVTGDRDLFQLVSDEQAVRILYIARGVGKLEVVTDSVVVSKYGVLPEQYADFATLRGDPSDGLPGVAGVGDKTAAGLLQKYGDLDGIRSAAADPTTSMASGLRGKLVAAASYLEVAPTVVAVAKDVTLEPFDPKLRALDDDMRATVEEAGEQWGLGGSVTRVLAALDAATT
jgi:5'-3' exonuclease